MSYQSLFQQAPVQDPLLWGEAGGRIKKEIGYVRHYMPQLRSPLEAADLVMITQLSGLVEFYMVDPRYKPFYTGRKRLNLATKWTTPLPKLIGNQNPGRNPIDASTFLNVALGEIALWKVYACTPGFQFDIEQPANTPVFTNGIQPTRLSYGNTGSRALKDDWGAVPEVATFEDKTPVTINVTPTNMNETIFSAYIMAEGYRYRMIKVTVPNPNDEPRVVITLNVSGMV